jgi:anti-sigma regulatory factor (Ser/Thr protein kinase)
VANVERQQAHRSAGSSRCALPLETTYPPRRESAAQMRRTLRAYLAQQAVDADVAYEVVLAADEAFVNAVTHAGSDGPIRVSACVSESEASVEVRDGGGGFAVCASHPRSVPDVLRPSGRGVFLIERMMDEVSVESGRGGTTVRMVRRLA